MIADSAPSMTARRVAAHRLAYHRLPWRHGDPAADDALTADVVGDLAASAGRMHEYLGARTAFFDRMVLRELERGTTQVVIGGAGYDGRALRYSTPGVRWFEVDHPATQRDKLARLRRLGIEAGHIRFVAGDFNHDQMGALLTAAGLEAGAPALFVLEGVAAYLSPAVLQALLGQFRDVAGNGSRLVISMPVTGTLLTQTRLRASVAAMGEPMMSSFEPAAAEGLLNRAGWWLSADSAETDDGETDDGEIDSAETGSGETDDGETGARRERAPSTGLLVGTAGPRAAAEPRGRAATPTAVDPLPGTPVTRTPVTSAADATARSVPVGSGQSAKYRIRAKVTKGCFQEISDLAVRLFRALGRRGATTGARDCHNHGHRCPWL